MRHSIKNNHLAIRVDEHGAELCSLVRLSDQRELLWQADPQYWQGQSPILFPTVGSSYEQTIRHKGVAYPMPKHGLVKDRDFVLSNRTADSLTFSIESDDEMLRHYPFRFRLSITYRLTGSKLCIAFDVENRNPESMPYLLGAHPAFALPDFSETDAIHAYLGFGETEDRLVSVGLKPGGFAWHEGSFAVELDEEGLLPLTNTTFECDTILDDTQRVRACALYNKNKEAIVSVTFSSPVLALWAPCGGRAPFVCIEPWWGLCDEDGYRGEFGQRPFINSVPPQETGRIEYTIEVC